MRKLLSLLVLFATSSLLAEELTFVCDYETSQLNVAPTKKTIAGWGRTYEAGVRYKNLCDQRGLEEAIRRGEASFSFFPDYKECKEKEQKKIFIDTETGFFKINEREYQANTLDGVKKTEIKRECFEADAVLGDTKLCKDTSSYINFEDENLEIYIGSRYKPEWCPKDAGWDEINSITDEEEKDQFIEVCIGLGSRGRFDGNKTFIEINRSTLKYSQEINVRSIDYKNNKLNISHSRGYGFGSVASWSDIEDEIGQCRLNRKQF